MKTYKAFSDYTLHQLQDSVNGAINQGYEPLGGISITHVHYNADYEVVEEDKGKPGILYVQAVYKDH